MQKRYGVLALAAVTVAGVAARVPEQGQAQAPSLVVYKSPT